MDQKTLDRLAEAGLVTSLAYGHCGGKGIVWSVDVLNRGTCETFSKPYAANDIGQAIEIALTESRLRGWID